MKVSYYQIKLNTHNTCVVGVALKHHGLQLLRVIPVRGKLPPVAHMLGCIYPSVTVISAELYKNHVDKSQLGLEDILIAPAVLLEFLAQVSALTSLADGDGSITAELQAHGSITLRYHQHDVLIHEQHVAHHHWTYQQPSVLNMYQKKLQTKGT